MGENTEAPDDTVPVQARVKRSTRKEWKSTVAESDEYTSLSHLIRVSVARELADTPEASGEMDMARIDELADTVGGMQGQLEDLAGQIESATEAMYTSYGQQDEWHTTVFGQLPTSQDAAKTPREIAHELAVDEDEVRGALEALSQGPTVKREDEQLTGASDKQYWRVK